MPGGNQALEALFSLEGRTVLVTGATGGLGLAMAEGLSEAGAQVVVHGRDATRVAAVARNIPRAVPAVFDLGHAAELEEGVTRLFERVGPIDVLVANAARRDRRPMAEIGRADFNALLDANLTANHELVRLLTPRMIARKWGRLIFVTSVAGTRATARSPSYVASKAGLAGLMRAYAVSLGPNGITSNAISPGSFATSMNQSELAMPASIDLHATRIPLRRPAQPQELVGAVVFLASRAGTYVNGHVLTVDGGWTATL